MVMRLNLVLKSTYVHSSTEITPAWKQISWNRTGLYILRMRYRSGPNSYLKVEHRVQKH